MNIIEALQSLGLNEKQAKVYKAVLSLGSGSAFSIADASGLKRPTTYVILEELIDKNIVFRIPRSRKKLYRAKSPEEVFEEAEGKIFLAKKILPEIKALVAGEKIKPRTVYYEGSKGITNALNYRLNEMAGKELVGFFAKEDKDVSERFSGNYKDYNDKLKKLEIKERGLVQDDSSLVEYRKTDKEYGREMKIIPSSEYSSDIAIIIGDIFVTFFDPKNVQSVVIENKNITNTLKQIFEMVWKKY